MTFTTLINFLVCLFVWRMDEAQSKRTKAPDSCDFHCDTSFLINHLTPPQIYVAALWSEAFTLQSGSRIRFQSQKVKLFDPCESEGKPETLPSFHASFWHRVWSLTCVCSSHLLARAPPGPTGAFLSGAFAHDVAALPVRHGVLQRQANVTAANLEDLRNMKTRLFCSRSTTPFTSGSAQLDSHSKRRHFTLLGPGREIHFSK